MIQQLIRLIANCPACSALIGCSTRRPADKVCYALSSMPDAPASVIFQMNLLADIS
jgi:hypothetical protein